MFHELKIGRSFAQETPSIENNNNALEVTSFCKRRLVKLKIRCHLLWESLNCNNHKEYTENVIDVF